MEDAHDEGWADGTLAIMAEGWHAYQEQLSVALAPLTPGQLALRAATHVRSIEELARHIIGVRAGWFHNILGEGDDAFGAYHDWDADDAPVRTVNELVGGLAATWKCIEASLKGFTPDAFVAYVAGERKGRRFAYKRGWVIWHVMEHDMHHGGEIGISLGMHGIAALDL